MKPVSESWLKSSPYDRFSYFIAIKVDRHKTLLQTIEKLGLNFMVLTVAGNRHFFIFPPGKKLPRPVGSALPAMGESPYMFVAHYDRVEGSPGANDNGVAVFHLLRAATLLAQRNFDNWIIVFTDKEEITSGESFKMQGSFTLAQKIKTFGLEKAKIYNFDTCGTGDTFVLSNMADSILEKTDSPGIQKIKTDMQNLRYHALKTAHFLNLEKVLLAPIPFCDDMGFLRAGFAAQTITILPSEDASKYEALLRSRPEFTDLIVSGGIKNSPEKRHLPVTWKNMNTPADTIDRLTPQFFDQAVNFMVELCNQEL